VPSPDISLVVPVYNEVESLPELYRQIDQACTSMGRSFELVFVDDGSTDGSAALVDELAGNDSRVQVVHFRRNFGKSPALAAGFERVRGRIVITMDADLQDNPAMIAEFVRMIETGADVVSGWKKHRRDPLDKTMPSKLFNVIVRKASGVPLHDFNCGFKAYTAECIGELSVYGGFHRFLPVLASQKGFRVAELVVEHRPRTHGASKFGARRFLDGLLDLLTVLLVTRFRTRPLHFFGMPGLILSLTGVAVLTYLSAEWFLGHAIGSRPLLILGVLLTITGMQFLGIGLLGELLVRTTISSREIFSIRTPERPSRVLTQVSAPEHETSSREPSVTHFDAGP